MFKNVITSAIASIMILPSAAFAQVAPGLAYRQVSTPYGTFGCMQRAENKFYSMGATAINKGNNYIFGAINDNRISVWCLGTDAFIVVAGSNVSPLRDEIYNAF